MDATLNLLKICASIINGVMNPRSLFPFVYSDNRLQCRNNSIFKRGENNSSQNNKEIGTAKISLIIALVFITCHLVKWVPNIHEIVMVRK